MIPALLVGKEGSLGLPGKNTYPVMGQPLMYYSMNAAKKSKHATHYYFSTNSTEYKDIGRSRGWEIIDRPNCLATPEALGEDVFVHGYDHINNTHEEDIEFLVLLFCNVASVTASKIDEGIDILRANPGYDSAVSVSEYNMWSPLRARKIGDDGLLHPFVPFETFGDPKTLSCDRDSQGDVWFTDFGVMIIRPRCIEKIDEGLLPQKWMGQKIYPLKQWGGLDVDYEWQIPQVEFWVKKHQDDIKTDR